MVKKSVLLVCGVFYPEPIVSANLMLDLANGLSKEYNVTVLRPKPTRPMGFKMPKVDLNVFPFKVVVLDSYTCPSSSLIGRFKESYSMGKKVCEYIENHKGNFDFVYNAAWHLFGRAMITKTCLKYDIPYITPVQDVYPESLISKLPKISILKWFTTKVLMPFDVYCLRHAKRIHTISNKMKEDLLATRKVLKDEDFVVIRNWQNEEDFIKFSESESVSQRMNDPIFTFMYLGNVGPLAGIEVLFEALSLANLPQARLVIAGSGSAKADLQLKAGDYKNCRIEFKEVPSGMVPATQDEADVMCLPVKKGFAMSSVPSKLPAYMFSSKPVLAAVDKESDTAQCILKANAGWVAESENAKSIAELMILAYNTSKQELQNMGSRGFEYSIANFSRGKNLAILINACKQVIEA